MNNYIYIGTLRKPFGSIGYLKMQIEEDLEEILEEVDHVFVFCDGHYLPYFIEETKFGSDVLIKFDEFESPEENKSLSNKDVYITDNQVDIDKYKTAVSKVAIEDFSVINSNTNTELGIIISLEEFPGQTLARVKTSKFEEFLFPIVEEYITNIDFKSKKIYVSLPEGLVNL